MISGLALALTLSLSTGTTESAAAQKVMHDLRDLFPTGTFNANVGDYVVYRVGVAPYRYWRIAVVGKESTDGGAGGYWVETSYGDSPSGGSLLVLKVLSSGDPRSGDAVRKVYFKLGSGKTLELEPDLLQRDTKPDPDTEAPPGVDTSKLPVPEAKTSFELKQVPGGSFQSMKVETQVGMILWLAPDVPVFHVVAAQLPMGGELELYQLGHDAKDLLGAPEGSLSRGKLRAMKELPDGGPIR